MYVWHKMSLTPVLKYVFGLNEKFVCPIFCLINHEHEKREIGENIELGSHFKDLATTLWP